MKELLPHFERELILLRQLAAEFAERFPGLASHLQLSHQSSGAPHVERMIQATALLTARVNKSLEEGHAQFTESFLEVLFPHYLRPFPSCAIVQIASADKASGSVVPRGTELRSRPSGGVACQFRTCYDVRQLPVCLTQARFNPTSNIPPSIRLSAGHSASLSIDIETTSTEIAFASLLTGVMRMYLNGNPSLVAPIRDILHGRISVACVESGTGEWARLPSVPLAAVGFGDDDALVPFSPRSHPAYRLLTEYFTFPEKFNFVDIDLAQVTPHLPDGCRRMTLHLLLARMPFDSHEAMILPTLSSDNFLLGCTPVVNLFRQTAVPVMVTHERTDYPLLPDAEHAPAYDIHSVDSVRMLGHGEPGGPITEFRPFYSLHHGEDAGRQGRYFVVRRNEHLGAGHEHQIAFVDTDFDPAACDRAVASVELTCSNRDLPQLLECGHAQGDLLPPADLPKAVIRFLRRPTAPQRFARTPALQWRLLSHLTLNFRSLAQEGLQGLHEMLSLYDLAQSPDTRRQIASIVGLAYRPTTAWIRDARGASLVHGIEVTITLEENGFIGSGLYLFVRVIDRFLGLYVQINSFTELVALSANTGKELIRCQPRNGDQYLL